MSSNCGQERRLSARVSSPFVDVLVLGCPVEFRGQISLGVEKCGEY